MSVFQDSMDELQQIIDQLRARIAELEAERAELVKDRERLDWLQTADTGGYCCELISDMKSKGCEVSYEMTLRQAIDAAREGE